MARSETDVSGWKHATLMYIPTIAFTRVSKVNGYVTTGRNKWVEQWTGKKE